MLQGLKSEPCLASDFPCIFAFSTTTRAARGTRRTTCSFGILGSFSDKTVGPVSLIIRKMNRSERLSILLGKQMEESMDSTRISNTVRQLFQRFSNRKNADVSNEHLFMLQVCLRCCISSLTRPDADPFKTTNTD